MGLTEVQHALARLYTDGRFRERFFAAPATVGSELGLTPKEAEQLGEAQAPISRFARSLQLKRLSEAGRFLPATRRALGPQYGSLFLKYAVAPPPTGSRKPQEDALRFARFLTHAKALPVAWLTDLARFEAAWIEVENPSARLLIRRFRWPVHQLTQQDAVAAPAKPERCLGLWVRFGARSRLRHYRMRLP